MQLWLVRSCGARGGGRLGEVGRSPHHRHAHVRADAHGDHVLGHLLAQPDPGVITLGHDVGQAVVDDDLHLDVGIVRQEALQSGPEDRIGRVLGGGDPDGAGRLVAQRAQGRQLGVDLVEPWAHASQQAFARLGGRHAARGPAQQPQPEPRLEPANGVAERRLGHAELGRGPREAPLPRHGEEGQQVVEALARH